MVFSQEAWIWRYKSSAWVSKTLWKWFSMQHYVTWIIHVYQCRIVPAEYLEEANMEMMLPLQIFWHYLSSKPQFSPILMRTFKEDNFSNQNPEPQASCTIGLKEING
ncbi:hypothetical protein V6N12_027734 [Hibiscus sabdariffa]|uniref:Uncharacterized protein n=1 Tax=Hibiscus sabdariffa TaxID=183260 RepID=A0ABR2F3R1_9ROSI